ncbi:MAG: hypothetical protein ABH952_03220 [Candidatus Omnitrophota bacterium]
MKKRKYKKPKIVVKTLQTYFFACLQGEHQACTSYFLNKNIGSGCPN